MHSDREMKKPTSQKTGKTGAMWLLLVLLGAGVEMWGFTSVARGQDLAPVPAVQPIGMTMSTAGFLDDSVRPRPRVRSIEYSDWYARRLTIHKIGSYVMLPLFGAEYYLGERLIQGKASDGEKSVHVGVATAIGGLFAVNTVTGVWNLWDSRKDPSDRGKRYLHSVLMLAADAGFALAAASAEDDGNEGGGSDDLRQVRATRLLEGGEGASTHKAIAITSFGISTAGTLLMWFWK